MPEADDHEAHLATRRRKKFNLKHNESLPPESFCPICNNPFNKSKFRVLSDSENGKTSDEVFMAACCDSCQFQILPKEPYSLQHFCGLLPDSIVFRENQGNSGNQKWLRDQIQDCLLSDSEDGT